ncbi:MAG: isoleucine--tRNA ligase [Aestuariivita sp.]|nr:isoleucine--tRNA ligase [Aestuariivita sp.]MCY4203529.1 isoleucine--tRNA ligase [Aestuariivita sp.]
MGNDNLDQQYKDTLNLPRTTFPMRAGLPKREPEWLARWGRINVYQQLRKKRRQVFTLHDGPPYANGHLHIGHALNKTIKDMIVRSHQMIGFDSRFIPGWDCHGLPIEWKIEEDYRKKGKNKDVVPINEFRAECRKFAAHWVDIQREEFRRLGITGNWLDPYLTMDFHAERVIAEEFMKLLMNGTLYQGSKPVMWSPVEQTALAEAEVEYQEKESFTVWVKFRVSQTQSADKDPARNNSLVGANVIIWTTTPWTIPANKGVVYGTDIAYGLYEVHRAPEGCWAQAGDRYLLADKRAATALNQARLTDDMWVRVRDVDVSEFEGLKLIHPLQGANGADGEWDDLRDFRAADFVSEEEGTGFVHCAPSHGMEEYDLYRGLNMLDEVITYYVTDAGGFREDLPFFGGTFILNRKGREGDANTTIIDKLAAEGGLLARGKIRHSYPHSWRSKAPVIYRNTPQWFAAIDKDMKIDNDQFTIRERALIEIDKVEWTPRSGRNRLYSMMEKRPDWVLSRQRAWGVPITCFTKKNTLPTDPDFLLRNREVNQRIVDAFEAEGADAWYEEGAKSRFLSGIVNPDDYDLVTDILDVWFDSGSTHAFTLRDRDDGTEDGIADVYMEGTDQHRGWFHSSLLQSVGTQGHAPYRKVVTHGFTLDENGMKMSKSLGNIIAPQEVINQYGADILRLWVAQTDYTADQRIGAEILKGVADSYRRLRNTMRFMLGSLSYFTPTDVVSPPEMPELERYLLHRLAALDELVRSKYQIFDFQGVFQEIFSFATTDLSSFYFDIRKDTLYCDSDTLRRRAARTVLDILFHRLTTWLAPILVFTMEEVWLERYPADDSSVHLQDFPQQKSEWLDPELAKSWSVIRQVRRVVTAALEIERQNKIIGSSLEAAPTVYVRNHETLNILNSVDFADICITSQINLTSDPAPQHAFKLPEIAGIGVTFTKASGKKCQRCWKTLPDVGSHKWDLVCSRCDQALTAAQN